MVSLFLAARVGCVALLAATFAAGAEQISVHDLKTSLYLHPGALESLGWEIRRVKDAVPLEHHALSASIGADLAFASVGPFGLGAELDGHRFMRLTSGSIRHQGGFDLAYRGGVLSLQGFMVTPGAALRSFEVLTADGLRVFTADYAHFALDRERGLVQLFNLDLRITRELAALIGQPSTEGMQVGMLAMEAWGPMAPAKPAAAVAGVPGCSDFTGDVDVAMIQMSSIGQTERSGGLVSISPSAALKNVGTANVPWHAKFTGNHPPFNNDQHPYLVWHLYRLRDGVLEQMAVSDVKHAFLTLNDNCTPGACTDDHILGIGCEDVYSQGNNSSNFNLSFRDELKAGTGVWTSTCSHFDQNCDGVQDHPPGPPSDPFPTHRLAVAETKLDVLGERYFFETWYIVRADVNIYNSMGWREFNPNFNGSAWAFPFVTSFAEGPVINNWVNPDSPGANASNVAQKVADGNVRLAMTVTDLGGGFYRYEYALQNHDFDPQLGSFTVPVAPSAQIFDVRFRDIDDNAANDWQWSMSETGILFTKPGDANIKGLKYGHMYNFGFTATSPPETILATVTAVESSSSPVINISTKAPLGVSTVLFLDGFETGNTAGWDTASP